MSNTGLFYHERVPVDVLVAQAVGITAAAFLTGANAAVSFMFVPGILEAPAPLAARQWKKAYTIGSKVGPGLSALSAVACGWLASRESTSGRTFNFYTAAAIIIPSIIPYTLVLMIPTNKKLLDKADSLATAELTDKAAEAGVTQEETVHALIDKWATLNLGRAIITGIGSLCALWATLDRVDVVRFSEVGLASGANRMG